MSRTLTSLLAALAVVAGPALALAEEPTKTYPECGREPTDAEVAAAKGAFQAGNASFNEADYARAIDYWEDAYRRDCTANPLLLNLARAYELAGRKRQAVVALETFLAREPNSAERDQIARRVDVLRKKIADEDAAASSAPQAVPLSDGPTDEPGITPGPTDAPGGTQQARRSPWPWVVVGSGGALILLGGLGYSAGQKKLDEIDASGRCDNPSTPEIEGRGMCFDNEAVKEGNDARNSMIASGVIAGIGAAAVVGGVIWVILDGRRVASSALAEPPRRMKLTPVVSLNFAGFSLSNAF
jgi:tetratricopeptide (TPR) repeat protein